MRLFTVLAAAALAAKTTTAVVATQNQTFVAEQIAQISPCGLTCLQQTIPEVGCSILDTECQCASSQLVKITANCMYANCTFPETLALSRIQATICVRPFESHNHMMRVMTICCAVITISAVFSRLLTKFLLSQIFGLDDLFIVIALITECFFTAFGVKLEEHGFGDHVWTINNTSIPKLLRWFYACEMLYVLTIGFVKISLLFFYLRVFPKRSFRILCWATLLCCVLSSVAFILVTVFQCAPIHFVWDKNIAGGRCLNYNAVAWSNAAINIVQDLIIVVLPVRETMSLQLSLKQKVGLVAMFCVGGFVCITSMIRLESLRTFGLTADPTWDNIPTTFWSTLETTAAIFCACMPAVRAGLVHVFPFLPSMQTQNTNNMSSAQTAETPTITKSHSGHWVASFRKSSLPQDRKHAPTTDFPVKHTAVVATEPGHDSTESIVSNPSFVDREKPLPLLPEDAKSYV